MRSFIRPFFLCMGLILFPAVCQVLAETPPPTVSEPPPKASEPSLLTRLNQGAKGLEQILSAWKQTKSNMTRGMLLQQLNTRIDLLSEEVKSAKEAHDKDESKPLPLKAIKILYDILQKQQRLIPSKLRDLFHAYEQASLANKPLNWLTISVAMSYQTKLYVHQQSLIELLPDKEKKIYQHKFRYLLLRDANDLASFLQASVSQQEQIRDELGNLSKSMRQEMQDRLAMQQRISQTISDNINHIIPLLKKYDIDVTRYNQLTFSASGKISDLVMNSSGVWQFFESFFLNSDKWLSSSLRNFIPRAVVFIVVMIIFFGIARVAKKLVSKMVRSKHSRLSTLVQDFFIAITGKTVVIFGILVAFSQVGVDLAPVLAGLGVAGIVIGFALQDTLSNFASGMMILIYRPFDVGDYVDAGGVSGKVSYMSLVNTTIRTFDNQKIMVPNNKIWGDTINNITAERVRRVDMEFGIAYSDDVHKAEQVLKDIIDTHPDILSEPEPIIKLMRLGDSSVDFIVRPWVKTEVYWDVYWDITRTVKLRFDEEGLTIPFPQREVHLPHSSSELIAESQKK